MVVPSLRRIVIASSLAVAWHGFASARADRADDRAAAEEQFEKQVRPILVERCQKCHGAQKQRGNLRLDSRAAALQGGDSGAAIVPGQPEESLLVEAIRYGGSFEMPPKGKLPAAEVAALTEWVRRGAAWPAAVDSAQTGQAFDLNERRRKHWFWQPVVRSEPPAVRRSDWPLGPTDCFVLARLEQAGIEPAAPADRRTLIRRLSFDLVGLPPTSEEVRAFVEDRSPQALEKLVDRLLASPHFGERWARHWLDLVRYAESHGHEFDRPIFGAWQYRDYVIRAFNDDLPFDRFVLEQLAGDLLEPPRLDPRSGANQSLLGSGFFWLGEQTHSPVDVLQHAADRIDNQIDVLSKTFLGLTVACARCHDHKFDAISTRDYYAMFGIVAAARYAQRSVDPPQRFGAALERLAEIKRDLRQRVGSNLAQQTQQLAAYLQGAARVRRGAAASDVARDAALDEVRLGRWHAALARSETEGAHHPLAFWAICAKHDPAAQEWRAALRARLASNAPGEEPRVVGDFTAGIPPGWSADGPACHHCDDPAEFLVGRAPAPAVARIAPGWADSARVGRRLQGVLRSPTFPITHRYLHVFARGAGTRMNAVVDGFSLICEPIYGGLKRRLDDDAPRWHTFDLAMWKGHAAYLELADTAVQDPTQADPYPVDGHLAVRRAVLSDGPPPPHPDVELLDPLWHSLAKADSPAELAQLYQTHLAAAIEAWTRGCADRRGLPTAELRLLESLLDEGLLEATPAGPPGEEIAALVAEYHTLADALPAATLAPATIDGNALPQRVMIRGNVRNLGEAVPRRNLEALGGNARPWDRVASSGRLELAQTLLDENRSLVARVAVNRVWQHLFGRGIVATVDNFGELGERPSHPELLDYLADRLVRQGWSTKRLVRELVLSRSYQMSSRPQPAARAADPGNRLWHAMPSRRLEGEAIRDALLAVAGRLDRTRFGPSVPVHLTPFMDGRGRPAASGPPDGDGRRSVYLEVRRNFLSPLMLAFDTPIPFSTVGRRSASNVPAQALIMLNDPLVSELARRWAERCRAGADRPAAQRIAELFETALARLPTPEELRDAEEFLAVQGARYGATADDARAWADLCHVILNLKEFVFLN